MWSLKKLGAFLSATFLHQVGAQDDASLYCLNNDPFCQRTREWKID